MLHTRRNESSVSTAHVEHCFQLHTLHQNFRTAPFIPHVFRLYAAPSDCKARPTCSVFRRAFPPSKQPVGKEQDGGRKRPRDEGPDVGVEERPLSSERDSLGAPVDKKARVQGGGDGERAAQLLRLPGTY